MTEKLSAWKQYKKNLGESRPWDFLNLDTNYVEESVRSSRMSTCEACPELIQLTKTCKKCGCFMAAKTKLSNATCPINKW